MKTQEKLQSEFKNIQLMEAFSVKLASEVRILQAEFEGTFTASYPNAQKAHQAISAKLEELTQSNGSDKFSIDDLNKLYEAILINITAAKKDDGIIFKVKYAAGLNAIYEASYAYFQRLQSSKLFSSKASELIEEAVQKNNQEIMQKYHSQLEQLRDELNQTKNQLEITRLELDQSRVNHSINHSQLDASFNASTYWDEFNPRSHIPQSFVNTMNKPADTDQRNKDKKKVFQHVYGKDQAQFGVISALQKYVDNKHEFKDILNTIIFQLNIDPNNKDKYQQIKNKLSQGINAEVLAECVTISKNIDESVTKPNITQLQAIGQVYKTGSFFTKNIDYVTYCTTAIKAIKELAEPSIVHNK